ncbi:uncharacterized protein LOC129942059 [Eupeodes corollae]|uniref:uncharacterized protein LOC129942059 n=1 Tax=Eupeodes corollae TaxID=290404 RepID=UPI00248FED53|nr:uncharacterized protein LOC129942059 [Eupeodes corollae]
MEPNIVALTANLRTSKKIWDFLLESYDKKGPRQKTQEFRKLTHLQMSAGESVAEYVREFKTITNRLKELGAKLDDDLLVVVLLDGLSDDYKGIRSAFDVQSNYIDVSTVSTRLLEVGDRKKEFLNNNILSSKHYHSQKHYKKHQCKIKTEINNFPFTCRKCGKRDHMPKDCWTKTDQTRLTQNGTVKSNINVKSSKEPLYLYNTLLVPKLTDNHISISMATDHGYKKMVHGLPDKFKDDIDDCTVCIRAKQTVTAFRAKQTLTAYPTSINEKKTSRRLELVHSDICGPMRRAKTETFKKCKVFAETQSGEKVKTLRKDNGLEYCNKDFQKFVEDCGIFHQKTVPYTPQQNGLAERANGTLTEMARCLMDEGKLPEFMWAELVNTLAFLRNRCPTKPNRNVTPEEMWSGKKPNILFLKEIGSKVYTIRKGSKLDNSNNSESNEDNTTSNNEVNELENDIERKDSDEWQDVNEFEEDIVQQATSNKMPGLWWTDQMTGKS